MKGWNVEKIKQSKKIDSFVAYLLTCLFLKGQCHPTVNSQFVFNDSNLSGHLLFRAAFLLLASPLAAFKG